MSEPPSSELSFIPDWLPGPLDNHRKQSAFDWRQLKAVLENIHSLRLKYKVWKMLESEPLFAKSKTTPSADEQKKIAAKQMMLIAKLDIVPPEVYAMGYLPRYRYLMSVNEALHAICPSLSVKIAVGVGLFQNALRAMGTEQHSWFYNAAWSREIVTCLAITEVSHGSNTKRVRTTATYDPEKKEFIINTPDFEAAKCWAGNLGKTATTAIVFANLITPDGQSHGLHGLLVPIRNPLTLQPYPGVLVGDMGEKIGLNGIDNGFVMFTQYRVPRENLLNRTAGVTPEGEHESVFSEPSKILGAALEGFSAGRLGIMQEATNTLSHSVVIAVRYAAIRKQFGPDKNGPEQPIIEYQLHQWRIFPFLAAACVLKTSVYSLTEIYLRTIEKSEANSNGIDLLSQSVGEIHALVSASKPMCTWTARDAIQEAREACGGHGYLKAANLGELRNNHDACLTYEGDNNVLGQQASNWLLRQWTEGVESPLGTVNFIQRREEILQSNFESLVQRFEVTSWQFINHCLEWLMCWLMQSIAEDVRKAKANGACSFEAKNNTQVYKAKDLSIIYAEFYAISSFRLRCRKSDVPASVKPTLECIHQVYGLWVIDRHMVAFYQGSFASGAHFAEAIRTQLLSSCRALKADAVTVADSLAPPDYVLNSVIAKSDGLLYQNLQNEFMTNPGALERANWWWDVLPFQKSKL
ncbi:peroxisomal acyl-coenzyme A oxidase 3 [Phlebotomus argentipes]|uniref:peroxisomal acyl-coenzyme A oxidase 3 n=1 Tax=Phlebotomus argentipes TaxID=94469 RepID=UPI002892C1C4|nr:peroxisomal acyl-coenzyme A oxidase 3 [Phlebotomus argentipes]